MSQHDQEHPLILELLNLKKAIDACPTGPERDHALHRADLAISYAESVIARYEGRQERLVTSAVTVGEVAVKGLRHYFGFPPKKK
jgi:hypothetical protein